MTRTTSTKATLKQGAAVFLNQLKRQRTPMIIFAIVCAFLITVIFSLTLTAINNSNQQNEFLSFTGSEYNKLTFSYISAFMLLLATSVFSLIYALNAVSYLHNRRKADMISPMPVKSSVIFFSKSLAAFASAVIPALFFLGIIFILALASGLGIHPELPMLFWQLPLGSAACIAFMGLMAICCGNIANTILTYLAICFAYPLSMFFIRGMIGAFFTGIPLNFGRNFFLFKALNPFAAYDGVNVIYWLLFIVACTALDIFLLRRRKAERAQTSFAFRLPCYIVEVLITFIAGMLMGIWFGSMNVLGAAFGGFVFGFLLGGAAAFVVAHVILFHSFRKILKSLIYYGAVTAAAIIFAAVCVFGSRSYVGYMPNQNEIASAGFLDFSESLSYGHIPAELVDTNEMLPRAAEDFTDQKDIESILDEHKSTVKFLSRVSTSAKFGKVFGANLAELWEETVFGTGYDNSFGFAYKLDGSVVTRYYDSNYLRYIPLFSSYNDFEYYSSSGDIYDIITGETYQKKYGSLALVPASEVTDLTVVTRDGSKFVIDNSADAETLYNTLRDDYAAHYHKIVDAAYSDNILASVSFKYKANKDTSKPYTSFFDDYDQMYYVIADCERTLKVLQDIGAFDGENKPVTSGKYYKGNVKNGEEYYPVIDYDIEDYGGAVQYFEDEEAELTEGHFTLPFDCYMNAYSGYYFYNDADNNILVFEASDVIGNGYTSDFSIVSTEKEGISKSGACEYGTAKIKADGVEKNLRYVKDAAPDNTHPYVFVTDDVPKDDYQKIIDTITWDND